LSKKKVPFYIRNRVRNDGDDVKAFVD